MLFLVGIKVGICQVSSIVAAEFIEKLKIPLIGGGGMYQLRMRKINFFLRVSAVSVFWKVAC